MISSVVPLKSPVTSLRSATNLGQYFHPTFHEIADGSDGTALLSVVFDGRFSPVGVTAAAHSASERGSPAGVVPLPDDGTKVNSAGSGAVPGRPGAGDVEPPPDPMLLINVVTRELSELTPWALLPRTTTRMR
jgi:hypothetical protein